MIPQLNVITMQSMTMSNNDTESVTTQMFFSHQKFVLKFRAQETRIFPRKFVKGPWVYPGPYNGP